MDETKNLTAKERKAQKRQVQRRESRLNLIEKHKPKKLWAYVYTPDYDGFLKRGNIDYDSIWEFKNRFYFEVEGQSDFNKVSIYWLQLSRIKARFQQKARQTESKKWCKSVHKRCKHRDRQLKLPTTYYGRH